VTSVVFRGLESISQEDIKKEVFTKVGYPFAEYKVEQDQVRIVELLKKKGHYFAEVKVATGEYGAGRQVVFTVIEGPEVDVDEIRFVGNETFTDSEIMKGSRMLTEESGFFSSGPFVEKTLRQDLVAIANYYRSEGFLDVLVELSSLTFSPDKEDVDITIGVHEETRYTLGKVTIEGGEFPADRSELEALVDVKPGDPRREEDIFNVRRKILNYYLENAYYNARVMLDGRDDSTTHTSDFVFRIEEGSPVSLRRIDVKGNTITREDVIRRNLSVHPGGPLNSVEVDKSLGRLDALGYFAPGSVRAKVVETDDPGVKDLELSLTEGRTGSIRFSVGITSDLGLAGLIELKKRNFDWKDVPSRFGDVFDGRAFTGGGQTLNIMFAPGTSFSQFSIAFTEPWFLPYYIFTGPSGDVEESPFSLGLEFYSTLFSRFDYDDQRTGFSISTGKTWRAPHERRIDDVVRSALALRIENVALEDFGNAAPPNAYYFKGLNRENSLRFTIGWDHVDLPASPGKGFETDLAYTLAGGPLQGEIDYNKIEYSLTTYHTLYTTRSDQRHILMFRGRIGAAAEFGDTDQVPIFDRFFAGGHTTVRGFPFGEVGPKGEGNPFTNKGKNKVRKSTANNQGDPMGGEALWLFRAEYGFPLYQRLLRGVVFFDSGNVADTWKSDDIFTDTRASVGFGVRIALPFFGPTPVALDFGWPVRKVDGDDTQIISFSLDRPF
jgi:outer membrane protein insertion porin family